jgi:hypothetical protein
MPDEDQPIESIETFQRFKATKKRRKDKSRNGNPHRKKRRRSDKSR